MVIFPAIDLKNGKCVRLQQGKFDNVKVFNEDPVSVAKEFEKKGAEYIHLVDLDGALEGELVNRAVIEKIVKSVNIPCELGGGIRTIERIEELLDLGISRVILGTIAIKNPEITKEAVKKFGGWVDDVLNWFYNIFTSIPYLLLVLAIAAVLQQKGILSIVLILGLTGWTGVFRLVRAEYMKHTSREYVLAAKAIGVSHSRSMFVHIFPNVSHIALVQISILVVSFIKSEVILSFLGFGVPVGVVSWGSMLNEAQSELILVNGGNWQRHLSQWRCWLLHSPCLPMHCVML